MLTFCVWPLTLPARARDPWTFPKKIRRQGVKLVPFLCTYICTVHVTSENAARYCQGGQFCNRATRQHHLIPQRTATVEHNLVCCRKTFQLLNIALDVPNSGLFVDFHNVVSLRLHKDLHFRPAKENLPWNRQERRERAIHLDVCHFMADYACVNLACTWPKIKVAASTTRRHFSPT